MSKLFGMLFGIVAFLCGIGGLGSLSQATYGVGLICLGAVFGILARLLQAEVYNKEQQERIDYLISEVNIIKKVTAKGII